MYITIFFLFIALALILLAVFNEHLPVIFCHKLGWHLAPRVQDFNGNSATGVCPRCNKKVLRDSQGNWF